MLAHIPSETSGLGFFFIVGDQLILHCETFCISKGCMLLGPVNVFVGELKLQVPGGDTVVFCFLFFPVKSGSPSTLAHSWFVLSFHPQGILMCSVLRLPRH